MTTCSERALQSEPPWNQSSEETPMDSAQSKRQAEADRIRGQRLGHVHTEHCRIVPTRDDMLDMLPNGGRAVEVGVASGDFSQEIILRLRPDKLYLVDECDDCRPMPSTSGLRAKQYWLRVGARRRIHLRPDWSA